MPYTQHPGYTANIPLPDLPDGPVRPGDAVECDLGNEEASVITVASMSWDGSAWSLEDAQGRRIPVDAPTMRHVDPDPVQLVLRGFLSDVLRYDVADIEDVDDLVTRYADMCRRAVTAPEDTVCAIL